MQCLPLSESDKAHCVDNALEPSETKSYVAVVRVDSSRRSKSDVAVVESKRATRMA